MGCGRGQERYARQKNSPDEGGHVFPPWNLACSELMESAPSSDTFI
jgi:hypothetical protein